MVYGIDKFKEYFADYAGQYVFIGGTACYILLNDIGSSFRATKDLDMVLLIEAIDENFGITFWKFIEDGTSDTGLRLRSWVLFAIYHKY